MQKLSHHSSFYLHLIIPTRFTKFFSMLEERQINFSIQEKERNEQLTYIK